MAGFEDEVRKKIKDLVLPYVDEAKTDTLVIGEEVGPRGTGIVAVPCRFIHPPNSTLRLWPQPRESERHFCKELPNSA